MSADFDDEVSGSRRIQREADTLLGGFGQHLSNHAINRRYTAHFGATIHLTYVLWCLLDVVNDGPVGGTIEHLLWTLMFFKIYGTNETMARACKCDPNTFRKRTWLFIDRISEIDGIVSYMANTVAIHM